MNYEDTLDNITSLSEKEKEFLRFNAGLINQIEMRRESQGLSQRELADKAGVHHSVYARWASGETTPKLDTFIRFVKAVGFKLTIG